MEEFYTILPRQPYRPDDNPGQVRMEFEAVLLDAQRNKANQLWIHARIKACVIAADCVPVSTNRPSLLFSRLQFEFVTVTLSPEVIDGWPRYVAVIPLARFISFWLFPDFVELVAVALLCLLLEL